MIATLRTTRPHNGSSQEGSALLTSVAILTMMSAIVLAYLAVAVDSSKFTEHSAVEGRLESAAESATALAVHDLWGGYLGTLAVDEEPTTWSLRLYLDGLGIDDQAGTNNPVLFDELAAVNLAQTAGADDAISGVIVDNLGVWREDDIRATRLHFEATVSERPRAGAPGRGNMQRRMQQIWTIDRREWDGLDYALLANNINCIMCHTEVDDARRFYNTDPADFGSFDRVKLGSLESFQLRDAPESWVAGTLYLAGRGLQDDGTPISNWGSVDFKSREFDAHGYLVEDLFGDLTAQDLSPADATTPLAFENLYLDYVGEDRQVDGYFPDSFPSPFPDDGGVDLATGLPVAADAGNRVVDDSEFLATAGFSNGAISGGAISVVAKGGNAIDTAGEIGVLEGGTDATLASITDGHVYLYGTEADPILLNGDVAINGDLILQGVVKGRGSLKVSGNVYMPSDVIYADGDDGSGNRTFGLTNGGEENALAVASGGNIMVGNIFHPAWGSGSNANGDPSGSFNFIMDELALFNRMEWIKTQPTLPGKTVQVQIGTRRWTEQRWNQVEQEYFEDVDIYDYVPNGTFRDVPIYEMRPNDPSLPAEYQTLVRVLVRTDRVENTDRVYVRTDRVRRTRMINVGDPFDVDLEEPIMEWQTPVLANALYEGVDYLPRFYNFTENSTVPIFNKQGYYDPTENVWHSAERAEDWDPALLTYADPTDTTDPILFDGSGNPKAVLSALTGAAGWISDEMLRLMMERETAGRDASKPLEIDATLYSNNSIFGIIPGRDAPGLDGRMLVNGAIIAADIGLLAPERFQLNFDARGKALLDIRSDDEVVIRRQLWAPTRP